MGSKFIYEVIKIGRWSSYEGKKNNLTKYSVDNEKRIA